MASLVGEVVLKLSFDGKNVNSQLNKVESEVGKTGKKTGSAWGRAWAVAAGSLIATGVSKVASMVTNTMGKAIGRLDTLNNFPKVMQSLGYSSEEANASVTKISDALDGLPTSLDAMVADTQKLAASLGNLAKGEVNATTLGLGLNDMLLAGGKGTAAASAAMEQYNQMLARGKVDMQSWGSLVNAAPGQMDQLAKSILGANATQAQLYQAMQDGTVSFDQLNAAIVKLDKEGGQGFGSFYDQAVAATGGIATMIENIGNSMNKIVAAALAGNLADMDKYTAQLTERIAKVAPTLIRGYTVAFNALAKAFPGIIAQLLPPLLQGLTTLSQGIIQAIPLFIQMLVDATPMLISGIGQIAFSIIQALPDILSGLIHGLETFTTTLVTQLVQMLLDGAPMIVDGINRIMAAITGSLPRVVQAIVDAAPMIIDGVLQILDGVIGIIPMFVQMLVDAAPMIMDGMIKMMNGLIQALPIIIPALIQGLVNLITTFAMQLTRPDFLTMLLQAAVTLFLELVKAIPKILVALVEALPQIIDNIISWLTDPNTIGMLIDAAIQLFMALVMAVPQILGALIGAFGTLVGNLWNGITSLFGDFAANFGNFIGDIFKGAINGVLSFIEGIINGPIDIINGFIGVINDAFGGVGVHLDTIGHVELPRLAQGGVATGASAAIIGEAGTEVVLPLQQNTDNWSGLLASALAEKMDEQGEGGRTVNVYMTNEINSELDAQDIGRVMIQSIRRAA